MWMLTALMCAFTFEGELTCMSDIYMAQPNLAECTPLREPLKAYVLAEIERQGVKAIHVSTKCKHGPNL